MGLLLLSLLLAQNLLLVPSHPRLFPEEFSERLDHKHVPAEFTSPLELQRHHFALMDDYGIRPQHPKYRIQKLRKESEKLQKSYKSKRDEPNFEEYYYDDLL